MVNNFKLKRLSKCLSQKELANLSNVSINTISKLENGKVNTTQLGLIKRVSIVLDCTIDELF
ncbi:MAG: helix-turn-helix transcriptional regulator [Clostridium baratii]|uniref:Helix-turn-helix family protein n=1 Tax=Clostridium baratii str. Sullivan TaxID=1415775 RepID=A0A0A7FS87_9CLOT|nr:helix-turn-helix transcriptional regulator [Clostridium baratii]AIY82509.1 helix-turn-helix family protein [Clostridium baratii str. Sullivan]MDU1854790.1 helix-turn-helix transcriptional regulator [Clostridium baratii]